MNKISIIIPIYNAEKYLNRCIDSVLSQTYADFELILVNDGSTDQSAVICNNYIQSDCRVKYIEKINEGVSIARNIGITNSCGEYITFIDADDFIAPQYLEYLIKSFEKEGIVLAEVSYEKKALEDGNGKEFDAYYEYDIDKVIMKYLDGEGYVWGKLFLKEVIISNKLYFSDKLIMSEDLEFLIKYCCCVSGKYVGIKNKLYYYCDSESSISRSKDYKKLKVRLESGKVIKENLLRCQKNENIIYHIDRWIVKNIVWVCFEYFYHCNTKRIKLSHNELKSIFNYINYVSIDAIKKDKFYIKYALLKKIPNAFFVCYKLKKILNGKQ